MVEESDGLWIESEHYDDLLAERDAAQKDQRWISISDRQPEVGQCVVMSGPQGRDAPGRYWRLTGIRKADGYYDSNGCGCNDITHWYPLLDSPALQGEQP